MKRKAALLDTSFFIRFLNDDDLLFKNADAYFRYFLQHDIDMIISTIAIGEYCVRGNVTELPLRNLQILPYNFDHAKRAGELAKIVFDNKGLLELRSRTIIPNDTKLFAQADIELAIEYYLSADSESKKIYDFLKNNLLLNFTFINLSMPYNETFGVLDLI